MLRDTVESNKYTNIVIEKDVHCVQVQLGDKDTTIFEQHKSSFYTKYNMRIEDVPGLGDCQLYAVTTNYFNSTIMSTSENYGKLTILKRSIINLAIKSRNKFYYLCIDKLSTWRSYTVGQNIPQHL